MTDQAVDTGGVRLSEDTSAEGQFLGRARELKELRADIERAGLDTIAGRKAPAPGSSSSPASPAPAAPHSPRNSSDRSLTVTTPVCSGPA